MVRFRKMWKDRYMAWA